MAKISGAEYLAKSLDAFGVRAVFFVPTILSRTLYELEQHTKISRIVTHGEKAAVYMADGYARASGTPGVCMAQNVGAANLAAGLRDPYLGCSPVVALTGGPYEWSRSRNFYQEIEDFPLFKPVTKFSAQVPDVNRLPDLLAQAFRSATSSKPGPTHLELSGHTGDITENQLVDAAIPVGRPPAVPALRMQAEAQAVADAARLLATARRPVIVAGGGVRASGAGGELVALAERLGIPIATSLNGKDTVPGDHYLNVGVPGLYSRACANEILLEADLVFFVGSQTGSQLTLTWQVPPVTSQVIHLDIEAAELGRHYPNTLPLLCDATLGLRQLLVATEGAEPARSAWVARAQELVGRWREKVLPDMESDQIPIRPERLCGELNRHLPADALLVADTGHAGMWTGGFIDLKSPGQNFIRAAGSLGWGLPAALGAQVAQPDRPVVLFTGDGGFWYHLSELETAARWRIPAVIVVNNNRSLNQEIGPYTEAYGGTLHGRHAELWHFADVDLAAVAGSLGALGLTVRKAAEFAGAMEQATAHPGPTVINVVSDIDILAPRGRAELAQP
ncbi:MAG TPA: thiamine pyrophosphate-binding protein [Mycobacteriales bacterium]|jgi:acetolactate synthase-1/2/3 large subunit|nr:thiamine pyrophosphate-binding protein [Mycobacteriales bacterium]